MTLHKSENQIEPQLTGAFNNIVNSLYNFQALEVNVAHFKELCYGNLQVMKFIEFKGCTPELTFSDAEIYDITNGHKGISLELLLDILLSKNATNILWSYQDKFTLLGSILTISRVFINDFKEFSN